LFLEYSLWRILFHALKKNLGSDFMKITVRSSNLTELEKNIKTEWSNLPQNLVETLVSSIPIE
jgi:hypothetical protein